MINPTHRTVNRKNGCRLQSSPSWNFVIKAESVVDPRSLNYSDAIISPGTLLNSSNSVWYSITDEAHYMLKQSQALGMLNLFARHSRHYNSGLTLISQTVDEFMSTEQAKEIYDQCDIRALMRHEDLGSEATNALGLTERDIGFVLQAQAGNSANYSECLLYATDGGKMRLNIKSNDFEHHVVEEDLNAHAYAYANNMLAFDQMSDRRQQEVEATLQRTEQEVPAADSTRFGPRTSTSNANRTPSQRSGQLQKQQNQQQPQE